MTELPDKVRLTFSVVQNGLVKEAVAEFDFTGSLDDVQNEAAAAYTRLHGAVVRNADVEYGPNSTTALMKRLSSVGRT